MYHEFFFRWDSTNQVCQGRPSQCRYCRDHMGFMHYVGEWFSPSSGRGPCYCSGFDCGDWVVDAGGCMCKGGDTDESYNSDQACHPHQPCSLCTDHLGEQHMLGEWFQPHGGSQWDASCKCTGSDCGDWSVGGKVGSPGCMCVIQK